MAAINKNPLQIAVQTQCVDASSSEGNSLALASRSKKRSPRSTSNRLRPWPDCTLSRASVRVLPVDSPTADTWCGEPGDDAGTVRAFELAKG